MRQANFTCVFLGLALTLKRTAAVSEKKNFQRIPNLQSSSGKTLHQVVVSYVSFRRFLKKDDLNNITLAELVASSCATPTVCPLYEMYLEILLAPLI